MLLLRFVALPLPGERPCFARASLEARVVALRVALRLSFHDPSLLLLVPFLLRGPLPRAFLTMRDRTDSDFSDQAQGLVVQFRCRGGLGLWTTLSPVQVEGP